ncbi:MAG: VOC family protein [Anaerolineales bacterium]|nr:VOC family protein [Anaerolineales bacterium]
MSDGSRYHSAVIFVRDIEAAKRFYTEVMGMEIDLDFGTNVGLKGGLTLWQVDPRHIIPARLGSNPLATPRANLFELYFETGDIGAAFTRVKSAGMDFLHELHEEPWGQRTTRFFDPDRHLIEIGEALDAMARRMRAEGMTAEQIARKSSLPLKQIHEMLGG